MTTATNGGTHDTNDSGLSLAIVGGGIAGILLTLSVVQHAPHVHVTLYESASKFGEIGAGVAFGPNAIRAMSKISEGVKRGFEKCATANFDEDKKLTYFDFRCGMNGKDEDARDRKGVIEGSKITEIFKSPIPDGGMVHRASFLDEMVALVPDNVEVRFKKRLTNITQHDSNSTRGVTLHFADGTSFEHDAIIGSDGIKSRTRILLLGADDPAAYAVFSGKYCYRGLIPMPQAIEAVGHELATNSQMHHGYGGHMLTFPVQGGKTLNVVAFSSANDWTNDEWVIRAEREKMYADFEGWGTTVRSILPLMQKPDIWALFNHPPAHTYFNGRLCITGDAAHASTPHQGAGAGMAVEDAYVLSMCVKNVKEASDFEAAFAAYDEVRRPRTLKLVRTSRECGQLFDFEGEGVGDDLAKMKENLDVRHDWIWHNDIDADVEAANRCFAQKIGK